MGVFESTAKKIIDFLGMSSLGQKTSANSLSMCPASDAAFEVWHDGAMPVSIGGSGMGNGDYIKLDASKPQPDGTYEINGLGGVDLDADDFTIRDTDPHYVVIEATEVRSLWLGFLSDLNQDMTVSIWAAADNALAHKALLASVTYQDGLGNIGWAMGIGAVGQGGTAGGATIADGAYYAIGALESAPPFIIVQLSAVGAAPDGGDWHLTIARRV